MIFVFHRATEQLEPSTVNKRPEVVDEAVHGANVQLVVEILTPPHPAIQINLERGYLQKDYSFDCFPAIHYDQRHL